MPPAEITKLAAKKKRAATRLPSVRRNDAPSGGFFQTQKDAIAAALKFGVEEFTVTIHFNRPGASDLTTKMDVRDFARLTTRRDRTAPSLSEFVPSKKLTQALREADNEEKVFYRTSNELFYALEAKE